MKKNKRSEKKIALEADRESSAGKSKSKRANIKGSSEKRNAARGNTAGK